MKPKLYSLIFTALIIFLASCRTAKKMYEKGNYDEAVALAAKKLQKDPDDPKLLAIIRDAYIYAEQDHLTSIRSHEESTNELKWEWMYNDYASLQRMHDAIYKVPSVYRIVNPADYSSMLVSYGEKAGDTRFDRGLSLMQLHPYNKESHKQAFREFQVAIQFKPGHRDILEKMDEAFEIAVTNVVVLPMQQYGGYVYSGYTLGGQNLDDQLVRDLQYSSGNEFVRFYSAWDARSKNLRIDQELDMRLSTMNVGRFYDQRSSRKVSKEILIKETVIRPDSIVKEYGWVHAEITTTRRTMHSDAVLQVNLRDEDGRWIWSDNFSAEHNWSTEFASYTGDARALSDNDKQLINRSKDYPPREDEVVQCLLQEINNNAVYRIKNYFGRY